MGRVIQKSLRSGFHNSDDGADQACASPRSTL